MAFRALRMIPVKETPLVGLDYLPTATCLAPTATQRLRVKSGLREIFRPPLSVVKSSVRRGLNVADLARRL